MMDVVTVGWLTVDDIVLVDGTCRQSVIGGGALYSAVGAKTFANHVGIHSAAGSPYFLRVQAEIAARGLDAEGVTSIDGNGLELWLLHESEVHKQQIPKLSSSRPADMDLHRGRLPASYATARGFHIAPQTPASSLENAKALARLGEDRIVTMDILSDVFIDARAYKDLAFLDHLTSFMPSESEIARIWGSGDIEPWLRDNALRHNCHLIAKLGERGSLVCEARTGRLLDVPALRVDAVDTTGAGDAYCGGFIAGLAERRSLIECASMGTVAASYVVEACGALATARPSEADLGARLNQILSTARFRKN